MEPIQVQGSFLRGIFALIVISAFFASVNADSSANITIDCKQSEHGQLIVRGDSISLAEVIKTAKCWPEARQIDIFALNTVIFDDDIDMREHNVNITIISPTLEIIPFLTKNQTQRQIHFNARQESNFVSMCIDKINGEQLQFHADGIDNRLNVYNSGKLASEIAKLKSQMLNLFPFPNLQFQEIILS